MIGAEARFGLTLGLGPRGEAEGPGLETPWHGFRFHVEFCPEPLAGSGGSDPISVCRGAFSEVTGLEATMEPKTIKEGGWHYGVHQRPGGVTFATVVLKRGMTTTRHLWDWFYQGASTGRNGAGPAWGQRLGVIVVHQGLDGAPLLRWKLLRAMPIKFKAGDLSAKATEVVVEELHLVHEGLSVHRDAG